MEEKVLYSMESPFQQEINVKGYYFGKNEGRERSACIVGALRGNEYQQLYICSKLIDVLKKIEKHGDIVGENGVLVIPSVSNMSMDFGKRFWISSGPPPSSGTRSSRPRRTKRTPLPSTAASTAPARPSISQTRGSRCPSWAWCPPSSTADPCTGGR